MQTTDGTIDAIYVVAGDAGDDASHDVSLTAGGTGSITIDQLIADNVAQLYAYGSITDNGDTGIDVVAIGLLATAENGTIYLDTNVDNLTATADGTIAIFERDSLTVTGTGVQSTGGGDITITANTSIILGGDVTTTGDVVLVADNDGDGVGSITRTAGTVSGDDLILRAGSGIGSAIAPIVTAVNTVDAVNTASGEIGINDDGALTVVQAINTGRPVTITSGSTMTITGNVTGSDVTLASTTANINQTGGLITSTVLATLDAVTGINLIDTELNKVDASVSGPGAINIGELTDIELTDVDTVDGDIVVTTFNGTITVVDVIAGGADGDVLLTANGSVSGILVTSNGITAGEDVTLDSDGYISVVNSIVNAGGFVDMNANNGNVDITGSIISANNEYINITSPASVNITGASNLYASGYIKIYGDDYVGITGSSMETLSYLRLESGWNLDVTSSVITATGNISILADSNIGVIDSDIQSNNGYIDIDADYNVSIADSYLYGYDDIYIYGWYGNVTIIESEIISDYLLDIYAYNTVEITSSYLESYDDTYIYADNNITIGATDIYAGYNLEIDAGWNCCDRRQLS